MMLIACFVGGISGVVGTLISAQFSGLPTGPLIVLTSTSLFVLSWIFAPHRGTLWKSNDAENMERHLPWMEAADQQDVK